MMTHFLSKTVKFRFLILSLLFIVSSCEQADENYSTTEGTVVELKDNGRIGKGMRSYMVISYTDSKGVAQTGELNYDPLTKYPEVNDKISFKYNTNSPNQLMEEDSLYNTLTKPDIFIWIIILLFGIYWVYKNVLRNKA
ncbi:hypothetical protein J2X31_003590 [Flavobacterium arsenatis]|uniref:DUF3592 domain-containing protein n=1 Tax=Flavobacterium arsenatis TaxID=1484332 RepID=A0ABU1TUS5_9FLAO|nr:hypothetical protein [Flavobacterium arsenatis]MDR6969557.1 hypothetical protein [Flavobacterium arsenatis]